MLTLGSQNGFDNSGRKGPIHWGDSAVGEDGTTVYPNLDRSVVAIELSGLVGLLHRQIDSPDSPDKSVSPVVQVIGGD